MWTLWSDMWEESPRNVPNKGSMALTPTFTDDTVRTFSYTPTEGTGHSFPEAEMLEFRDVHASLDAVIPGCSLLWLYPSPFLPYPATFGVFLFYN